MREARESLGGVHTCVAYVDLTGLVPGSLRYQNNANLAICEKKVIRASSHKTASTMDFTAAAALSAHRAGRTDCLLGTQHVRIANTPF